MKSLKNRHLFLYLSPALLFIGLFVGGGLFMAGAESVDAPDFSESHYVKLFLHEDFISSLSLSLYVTVTSTLLSLLVGMIITRLFSRMFKNMGWKYAVWIPMLIPHFVAAYLIFLFFSQSGWISSVFYNTGIIDYSKSFPILVNDPYYIGVILTYMWKEIPFVVLILLPIYEQMDSRYEDVVRSLGGKNLHVWFTVELPWLWPILLETGLILFAFIISAYEVPALLGVTYPKMLPILAYEWFYEGDWSNRPMAQALMISITFITVLSSLLVFKITKQWRTRMMKGS